MNTLFVGEFTGARIPMRFERYEVGAFFDEIFAEHGQVQTSSLKLVNHIVNLPEGESVNWQGAFQRALLRWSSLSTSMMSGRARKISSFSTLWTRANFQCEHVRAFGVSVLTPFNVGTLLKEGLLCRSGSATN